MFSFASRSGSLLFQRRSEEHDRPSRITEERESWQPFFYLLFNSSIFYFVSKIISIANCFAFPFLQLSLLVPKRQFISEFSTQCGKNKPLKMLISP